MSSHVATSCIRLFVLSAILWFSLPLLAADRNLTEMNELTFHNACERLLEADLSGYYVATNVGAKYSQLIQLRRLGHTSAYTVSTAKMDLPSTGIRELQFERTSDGWRIGDPGNKEARVNIATIIRDQSNVYFRFENASDPLGFHYDASPPLHDAGAVRGDILSPDEWIVNLSTGFDGEYRFTRIKLDRSFELLVSQSLKSLLATRLEPGSSGISDYLVTVELKTPLLREEAVELFSTELIYPMDQGAGTNSPGPYYKYAVPKQIYELLESIGHWTRRWEVAHIDALPFRMVNRELIEDIVNHINLNSRGFNIGQQQPRAQAEPARPYVSTVQRSPTGPPRPAGTLPNDALARLNALAPADIGGPRDLDEDRQIAPAATPAPQIPKAKPAADKGGNGNGNGNGK